MSMTKQQARITDQLAACLAAGTLSTETAAREVATLHRCASARAQASLAQFAASHNLMQHLTTVNGCLVPA